MTAKMKLKVGANINTPVIKVAHSSLKRAQEDSPHKSVCPCCTEGVLLMTRSPQTMLLRNIDTCIFCGQSFEYIDIPDNELATLNP